MHGQQSSALYMACMVHHYIHILQYCSAHVALCVNEIYFWTYVPLVEMSADYTDYSLNHEAESKLSGLVYGSPEVYTYSILRLWFILQFAFAVRFCSLLLQQLHV